MNLLSLNPTTTLARTKIQIVDFRETKAAEMQVGHTRRRRRPSGKESGKNLVTAATSGNPLIGEWVSPVKKTSNGICDLVYKKKKKGFVLDSAGKVRVA
ncbi:hypothetical protein CDAR_20981 [Caerostris darwini]|uniref:Uncharacterized protein n=1 Tax=Caerostris darwini TaxID=1538125 RepID=A0AAV4TTV9_9ARAC|nr:hypothetical protein CDAR_20981 [Caerostris darwini]